MIHSRSLWSACGAITILALFTVAACAQGNSQANMTEHGNLSTTPTGYIAEGNQGQEAQVQPIAVPASPSQVNAPSHHNGQRAISDDLVRGNNGGTQPFLIAYSNQQNNEAQSPTGTANAHTSLPASQVSVTGGTSASKPSGSKARIPDPDNLTFYGITFYGNIDVGAQHQTHGATWDSNAPQTGLEQVIVKNSNHAVTHYSQNGLSQSVFGLKGTEKLLDGVSLIFKLEPAIGPVDLKFTNSIQSLVNNNGVALANQTSNYDTNRAGKLDNGDAFFGIKASGNNKDATLVFGRVTSILSDNVSTHDPDAGSYAFSLISYQGIVSGGGDSEDLRLDSALKFTSKIGPYRIAALTQFAGHNPVFQPDGVYGSNSQIALGRDFGGLSADFVYSRVRDGISSTSLSATQVLTLPKNSLAATISDNTAAGIMAKYRIDHAGRANLYGGFVRIRYANPEIPLSAGITTIGSYVLSVLTQNAYTYNKILAASWGGAKYSFTPKLNVSGGYYTFRQNSYAGNGCTNNSNSKCSGNLNVVGGDVAYKLSKRYDVYGGAEWSDVTNGYSSGYLNTSTVTATVGGRFHF
jgi:predicted porin